MLALPLAYIYARNVLRAVRRRRPTRRCSRRSCDRRAHAVPARAVPRRRRHGPAVVALDASTPIASERFQVPEYESAWNAYPRGANQKEFDYSVYAFGAPAAGGRRRSIARRRRQRRPERDPLPRQGNDRRADVPLVAAAVVRDRRSHRRRRSHAGAVDERRRTARRPPPPADVHGPDRRPRRSDGARRPAASREYDVDDSARRRRGRRGVR